ncbi:uncharacterized protein LOC118734695 [Rhagoletis pomonella]|uniref:uncharacterized protein LOC118734695 n=1 Tax=Rhagoletis pomonella TaxID=28610 RepID=UPI00177D8BAB|nr:uncharacterized protein LOC118734695 [Rhagoletis pomonella]
MAKHTELEMICRNELPVLQTYSDPFPQRKRKIVYHPTVKQWMALLSGALIFVPGGMSMAFGLGWNLHSHIHTTMQLRYSWFVGFIIGTLLAAPLIKVLPKRGFMLLGAILVIIGGIIFTSVPYSYGAVLAARYINGIAIGSTTLAFLVHASEIAATENRGFCLWLEQNSMTIGIVIQVVYTSQWTSRVYFAADRLHGIIAIIFGVLAICCAHFIVESPIFFVRQCDDARALNCLRQLQRPEYAAPQALQVLLDEQKTYVVETETVEWRDTLLQSPLLRLLLYRSMVAFGFSLPMNEAMQVANLVVLGDYEWQPIVFVILRVGGTFSSLYMFDVTGRKMVSLVALLFTAALSIAIGGEYDDELSVKSEYHMSVICVLSQVFQFFAGLYAPSTSVYLSEAFPMTLKPYFIAGCLVLQQVIHIIVICTFHFNIYSMYMYTMLVGILMFVCSVAFGVTMPETRKTTLGEAQISFRKLLHFKCC